MIDPTLFADFVPTASLKPAQRADLARHSSLVELRPGEELALGGARDERWYFLSGGNLDLGEGRTLAAGTPGARRALHTHVREPGKVRALSPCRLLAVDRSRLDLLLTWSQTQGIAVVEVEELAASEEADWMTLLLANPALRLVPAPSIAQLFACLKPETFPAGATIIRQGEPGDRYFVIASGHVEVAAELARRAGAGARPPRARARLRRGSAAQRRDAQRHGAGDGGGDGDDA
ncbi:MAG: cyclic nucleotide-binding domain-containing protein [Xanthomonadales bacterium]|nr:cyclic nucleotide-binding domain-containing protein [Xanthomonadales bacterium]